MKKELQTSKIQTRKQAEELRSRIACVVAECLEGNEEWQKEFKPDYFAELGYKSAYNSLPEEFGGAIIAHDAIKSMLDQYVFYMGTALWRAIFEVEVIRNKRVTHKQGGYKDADRVFGEYLKKVGRQ